VINYVDDVLLMSLAVTFDQQRIAVRPAIHVVVQPSITDGHVKRWPCPFIRPSVRLFYAQQLAIRADLKYFLPLSVCYCVIVDGCRSSRMRAFIFRASY